MVAQKMRRTISRTQTFTVTVDPTVGSNSWFLGIITEIAITNMLSTDNKSHWKMKPENILFKLFFAIVTHDASTDKNSTLNNIHIGLLIVS